MDAHAAVGKRGEREKMGGGKGVEKREGRETEREKMKLMWKLEGMREKREVESKVGGIPMEAFDQLRVRTRCTHKEAVLPKEFRCDTARSAKETKSGVHISWNNV